MLFVPIPVQSLRKFLAYAITTMALGMYGVIYVRATFGRDHLLGFANKFDPRFEVAFHSWMGSSLLIACAAVLACIAFSNRLPDPRYRIHWGILAFGFAVLSADESTALHEMLIGVSQRVFGAESPTHFWAGLSLVGVAAIGVAFVPFLRHLPPWLRHRTVISAAVYLGGAIGLEMVGGLYVALSGRGGGSYYLALAATEELFELAGAGMFLVALYRFAFFAPAFEVDAGGPVVSTDARPPLSRPSRIAG